MLTALIQQAKKEEAKFCIWLSRHNLYTYFVYKSPFHFYYQITNVTFRLSIFFRKCNKMWVILQLVNVFVVE